MISIFAPSSSLPSATSVLLTFTWVSKVLVNTTSFSAELFVMSSPPLPSSFTVTVTVFGFAVSFFTRSTFPVSVMV